VDESLGRANRSRRPFLWRCTPCHEPCSSGGGEEWSKQRHKAARGSMVERWPDIGRRMSMAADQTPKRDGTRGRDAGRLLVGGGLADGGKEYVAGEEQRA
jgi:hypothetical protein